MAVIKLGVDGVTFDQLWNAFVGDPIGEKALKSKCFRDAIESDHWWNPEWEGKRIKKSSWENYCAIILSERLMEAGFSLPEKGYSRCNSHRYEDERKFGSKKISRAKRHFTLAADLATWLKKKPIEGLPDFEKATGSDFDEKFGDRNGIIYFKDYWVRVGQTASTGDGDHIDLWKKGRLPGEPRFIRNYIYEVFNITSPLKNSKEVWFWELP